MPISSKAFSSGGSAITRNIKRIILETTPPEPIVDANNEIVEITYEPLEIDSSEGLIQIYVDRNFELTLSETDEGLVEFLVGFESPTSNTETENSNRIKWPSNIRWQGGMEPPLPPVPGDISFIKLKTIDSGQTWYGQREWFDDYSYLPSDHWEIACDFAGNTVEDSLVVSGTVSEVDILEAGDHIVDEETYGRVYKLGDGTGYTVIGTTNKSIDSNPLGISIPVSDINKNRYLSVEGTIKLDSVRMKNYVFAYMSNTQMQTWSYRSHVNIYDPVTVMHGATKPHNIPANERMFYKMAANGTADFYHNSNLQTNVKQTLPRTFGDISTYANNTGTYSFPQLNLLTRYVYDFQEQTITVYFDGKVSTFSVGQDSLTASSSHPEGKNHVIFGFGGPLYWSDKRIMYVSQTKYDYWEPGSTTIPPIYLDNIRIKSYN